VREKLLINDVHLGVLRTGGTTLASSFALRQYLLAELRKLMFAHLDKDIIINGDLFDQFNVPMTDVLEFYYMVAEWMSTTEYKMQVHPKMILGRGNHDWSKDSAKLSSFDFIAQILESQFPDRVRAVTDPTMIFDGIYMIPHVANQDIFNLELGRIPEEARLVLLHANYDNNFAVESDHSLNVSQDQAVKILNANLERALVFGHEHQARRELGGRLIVTGNQWPSSIADCLNNPDGQKFAHIITERLFFTPICTWDANEYYQEVPWDEMLSTGVDQDPHFVRVCGRATSEQAPDVINAIAKYRQHSQAFVVSNAVKIEGVADMQELTVNMEQVRSFDVVSYLLDQLEPEQAAVVKELLAKGEPEMRAAA
jgi:hypothetical protein